MIPLSVLSAAILLAQGESPPPGEGQSPGEEAPPGMFDFGGALMPILLIVLIFYVLMIGPERRQRKKHQQMLAELGKGDRVVTSSGLYGTVAQVRDDVVTLQVADGVRMRFARSSIQTKLEEEAPESKS